MNARIVALVPAAGVGARAVSPADSAQPKQYQTIHGSPLLAHTVRALAACARIAEIAVVVSPTDGWIDEIALNVPSAQIPVSVLRCGGASRAESVRNGLAEVRRRYADADWVLVHDAARCCITPTLIDRLIDACLPHQVGGLLAIPVADTLKRANGAHESVATVDRSMLWAAQTPQMFRLGTLLAALQAADLTGITDEASAMEAAGVTPQLVQGASTNLKVTYPDDFTMAAALLQRMDAH